MAKLVQGLVIVVFHVKLTAPSVAGKTYGRVPLLTFETRQLARKLLSACFGSILARKGRNFLISDELGYKSSSARGRVLTKNPLWANSFVLLSPVGEWEKGKVETN